MSLPVLEKGSSGEPTRPRGPGSRVEIQTRKPLGASGTPPGAEEGSVWHTKTKGQLPAQPDRQPPTPHPRTRTRTRAEQLSYPTDQGPRETSPGPGQWPGSRYSHPRPWPLHHLLAQCMCLGVFAEEAAERPAAKTLPLEALLSGGGRGRRTKARWGRDTAGPRGLGTRAALWDCGQWAGARAGVGSQGRGWEPALRLGTGRASRSLLLCLALAPPRRDTLEWGAGAIQAPQWSSVCWPRRGGGAHNPLLGSQLARSLGPAGEGFGGGGGRELQARVPQKMVAGGLNSWETPRCGRGRPDREGQVLRTRDS